MKITFANVQFLPFKITWKNSGRARIMLPTLLKHHPHVVCLCEAFDSHATGIIAKQLHAHGFTYQQYSQHRGGLFIASKLCITDYEFVSFKHKGKGFDVLGRKGFMVSRLDTACIILTHLQSGNDKNSRTSRRCQYNEINKYVEDLQKNTGEQILIIGDFNEDVSQSEVILQDWNLPTITHGSVNTFSNTNPLVDRTEYRGNSDLEVIDWCIVSKKTPVSTMSMIVSEWDTSANISVYAGIFGFGKRVNTSHLSDHNVIYITYT